MTVASISAFHHNTKYNNIKELEDEIHAALGDISDIELFGQDVLCAPYILPARTASGLIIPGKTQTEDRWQSKVSLIIKMGTEALEALQGKNTPEKFKARFNGRPIAIGDWVFHDVNDCWQGDVKGDGCVMRMTKNEKMRPWEGWPVRIIQIGDIRGRTARPHEFV